MQATTSFCRACSAPRLDPILALGSMPLANALPTAEDLQHEEARYSLDLAFCPACSLVQIKENVAPEVLFGEYVYFSSYSDTMLAHVRALVEHLIEVRNLDSSSRIIEIASNDGYLLQYYKQRGIPVLGIEPAANVARVAESDRGIPTRVEFFDAALGARLAAEGQRADVVHANNVFAHVPDPNEFMAGLKSLLKPSGVAVIEAPYVVDFIDKLEFDTIYHEHYSYFSLSAVVHLCARHGLAVVDVEHVPIHGGSLRYFVAHAGTPVQSRTEAMLTAERARGVTSREYYADFSRRVWRLRDVLVGVLHDLKSAGRRLAAYGASAKGSTLLNAFGIGAEFLDFVVDRSPVKQGRYTPGTHLPIKSPKALLEQHPDYCLLLTWNFEEEILRQQSAYLENGGRFIVPIPRVRII